MNYLSLDIKYLISCFTSLYSLRILFIKRNLSWLRTESIKVLEIKTSILFNLDFASNTIELCFSFLFLIIDLWFLIPLVIAQIFNPIAELLIPIGIPIKQRTKIRNLNTSSNCRS